MDPHWVLIIAPCFSGFAFGKYPASYTSRAFQKREHHESALLHALCKEDRPGCRVARVSLQTTQAHIHIPPSSSAEAPTTALGLQVISTMDLVLF